MSFYVTLISQVINSEMKGFLNLYFWETPHVDIYVNHHTWLEYLGNN
jgi:beta-glucosidase/6-phospho-beta-glucosidase/beta-galactosidase